jgi:type IV secretory pathway TrbD component
VFRLSQAIRGPGNGGVVRRRVVPAVRAVVNGGLSALAFQELVGAGEGGSESGVTAAVLRMPGGTWLVAALGLVVVGVGVKQFVDAWRGDTDELTRAGQVPAKGRRLARATGRAGYVGRGVVFVLVGGFLARAAIRHDPASGVGLDAALKELLDTPFGSPVLVAVAAGLILFGAHCAVEARYSR